MKRFGFFILLAAVAGLLLLPLLAFPQQQSTAPDSVTITLTVTTADLAKIGAAINQPSAPPVKPPVVTPPVPVVTPPVVTPPTPNPAFALAAHPRFWGSAGEISAIRDKLARPEGKTIIANIAAGAALPNNGTGDRMLCRAFLGWLNSDASMTAAAVADFVSFPVAWIPPATNPDDVSFEAFPAAICFDWLYSSLTADQRLTFVAAASKLLDAHAGYGWTGYNDKAGEGQMLLALAIAGDSAKDYVADCYANNWQLANAPIKNLQYLATNFGGGGNDEGIGYYNECYTLYGLRGCWESATGGDKTLQAIGSYRTFPQWFLHQVEPGPNGAPALYSGWPFGWATSLYSTNAYTTRGWFTMLAAITGFNDPQAASLARFILDSTTGYTGAYRTAGEALLYGILIGDPRVTGQSPVVSNLPLTFSDGQYGQVYRRSGWTADATCLYLACAKVPSRAYGWNSLALFAKGQPLLVDRRNVYSHSYGPDWLTNSVQFFDSTLAQKPTMPNPGSTPVYGTFGTMTQNADGSWTGDSTKLYQSTLVKLARRTATFSPIIVTDEASCDASLNPHVIWNMPTEPIVAADNSSLSFTVNGVSCSLTFDHPAAQILKIGGPGHEIDGMTGAAFTTPSQIEDNDWLRGTDALKIHLGGFWRAHVVLPAGGGKLTTTIVVK